MKYKSMVSRKAISRDMGNRKLININSKRTSQKSAPLTCGNPQAMLITW